MKENYEHTPRLAGKLEACDFTRPLMLSTDSGCFFWFDSAFYTREDGFIVVYSEHAGYHVYYENSVEGLEGEQALIQ